MVLVFATLGDTLAAEPALKRTWIRRGEASLLAHSLCKHVCAESVAPETWRRTVPATLAVPRVRMSCFGFDTRGLAKGRTNRRFSHLGDEPIRL